MHQRTKKRTDYGPWVRWFGRTAIRLLGWRLEGEKPAADKMVIIAAPHASNWDLLYTLLAAMGFGIPAVFTIKDFWFFWPMGPLMYWLGGVPINRSKASNTVGQIVQAFNESDRMYLVIPPEGTRKEVKFWKMGFYWIAVRANVPILMGVIDYKNRVVSIANLFHPTGDIEEDFPRIQAHYEEKVNYSPQYDRAKFQKANS